MLIVSTIVRCCVQPTSVAEVDRVHGGEGKRARSCGVSVDEAISRGREVRSWLRGKQRGQDYDGDVESTSGLGRSLFLFLFVRSNTEQKIHLANSDILPLSSRRISIASKFVRDSETAGTFPSSDQEKLLEKEREREGGKLIR